MPRDTDRFPGYCNGKINYPTAADAAKAKRALASRRNAKPRHLEQFKCSVCSGWHLGTPRRTSLKEKQELGRRFRRDHPTQPHTP